MKKYSKFVTQYLKLISNQKGFTLIEAMISSTIILFSFLMLSQVIIVQRTQHKSATQALNLQSLLDSVVSEIIGNSPFMKSIRFNNDPDDPTGGYLSPRYVYTKCVDFNGNDINPTGYSAASNQLGFRLMNSTWLYLQSTSMQATTSTDTNVGTSPNVSVYHLQALDTPLFFNLFHQTVDVTSPYYCPLESVEIHVIFVSPSIARAAALQFEEQIVGGQRVVTRIAKRCVSVSGSITAPYNSHLLSHARTDSCD